MDQVCRPLLQHLIVIANSNLLFLFLACLHPHFNIDLLRKKNTQLWLWLWDYVYEVQQVLAPYVIAYDYETPVKVKFRLLVWWSLDRQSTSSAVPVPSTAVHYHKSSDGAGRQWGSGWYVRGSFENLLPSLSNSSLQLQLRRAFASVHLPTRRHLLHHRQLCTRVPMDQEEAVRILSAETKS